MKFEGKGYILKAYKRLRRFIHTYKITGIVFYNLCSEIKYLFNSRIRSQNARFLKEIPDNLPIPNRRLVFLVTGGYDLKGFYDSGLVASQYIVDILKTNGVDINKFNTILDFGCGCGRIMRFWKTLNGPRLYGADYNHKLVKWCKMNLPFADFRLNKMSSKLPYEDRKFDFIYAISVFTHLTESLQMFWINELKRVLKKDGFLLITLHGESFLYKLNPSDQERFRSGELVIWYNRLAGTNICEAFLPKQYVKNRLIKGFTIVNYISNAKGFNQDVYLLKKYNIRRYK